MSWRCNAAGLVGCRRMRTKHTKAHSGSRFVRACIIAHPTPSIRNSDQARGTRFSTTVPPAFNLGQMLLLLAWQSRGLRMVRNCTCCRQRRARSAIIALTIARPQPRASGGWGFCYSDNWTYSPASCATRQERHSRSIWDFGDASATVKLMPIGDGKPVMAPVCTC